MEPPSPSANSPLLRVDCPLLRAIRPGEADSRPAAHQVCVPDGEGSTRFTAYKDRRIRAMFADRTLLEMDAEWEMVRALQLPAGVVH